MVPPKKRQRRGSSEFDEYAEYYNISDDELLAELETASPPAPAARETTKVKSEPSTRVTRNSTRAASSKQTTKTESTQTQKKVKTSPKTTPKKKEGIDTFFTTSNSQVASAANGSPRKGTKKGTGSRATTTRRRNGKLPEDEDDDFVDDIVISSDDDDWTFSGTQSLSIPKPTQKPKREESKEKAPQPAAENLPWQYKYAPKSVHDLAVNKTKVQQIRSWLEAVFEGRSRQRLLILTGPAGAGKTATMECLSKDMGFDLLEWRNPTTNADGLHGADLGGYSSLFEEFLARAGKWNCLEIFQSDGKPLPEKDSTSGSQKKVIVIEDFPNTLTPSSAPLLAFQHSIKSFLALPAALSPSPLVLIITESAKVAGSNAFTAYRLLGPALLNNYLVSEIKFQPIARTFMNKALENVIERESRDSGRRWGPSRAILEKIGEIGDIRSAIASLEFMSVTGEDAWVGETRIGSKAKKKNAVTEIGSHYKNLLESVTQRESYLSIFHAVGKVVYNKRYGDDASDPYGPPPPRPPFAHQRYHKRPSVSPPHKILAELTTEISTFIAALHQNYLLSCRTDDEINSCLDVLSDADLLLPKDDQWGEAALRQEELSFEYSVRGLQLGLPSPVRRAPHDSRLHYPTSCKLWRKTEENEGIISVVHDHLLRDNPIPLSSKFGQCVLTTETIPYSLRVLDSKARRVRSSQDRPNQQRDMLVVSMRKYSRFGQVPPPSEDPDEAPGGVAEEDGTQRERVEALAGLHLDSHVTELGREGGELSEDEIVDSD